MAESSSSDDDIPLGQLIKTANKPEAVASSGPNYAEESSSEDDVPLGQLKKPAAAKPEAVVSSFPASPARARKKRISYAEEDEDDGEDFASPPPAKKTKVKRENGGATASAKVKKEKAGKNGKRSSSSSAAAKKKKTATKKPAAKKAAAGKTPPKKGLKQMDKAERIAHAMQAYLWWDATDPPKGCQWVKMEHAGVSFPPGYQPHGVKMLYDGEEMTLTPEQEEA